MKCKYVDLITGVKGTQTIYVPVLKVLEACDVLCLMKVKLGNLGTLGCVYIENMFRALSKQNTNPRFSMNKRKFSQNARLLACATVKFREYKNH